MTQAFSATDRRNDRLRDDTAGPLVFSHFRHSHYFQQYKGMICNHSKKGACIQTSQAWQPGDVLFFSGEQDSPSNTFLAETCWCRQEQRDDPDALNWYVGVRYL